MFLDTLRVNTKLKFACPRAGLEIPSIFCSTHGPRSVLVVVPALIVCHGQASLILGRWALMPTRCRAPESAIRARAATARRKIRATATRTAVLIAQRGMRRRRGPEPPGGPLWLAGPPRRSAGTGQGGSGAVLPGQAVPLAGPYGSVRTAPGPVIPYDPSAELPAASRRAGLPAVSVPS